ncbi:hypothetical protein AUJ14_05265 [Candidatus Micrarchaeota archaeon CG1_02_55_22]|nr:MAG: hypothetical protein AUJ14_05265 [Candidatus Micrarchaeota archaeon CG1_02_55_22]
MVLARFVSDVLNPQTLSFVGVLAFAFYPFTSNGWLLPVQAFALAFILLVAVPFAPLARDFLRGKTDLNVSSLKQRAAYYELWAIEFAVAAVVFVFLEASALVVQAVVLTVLLAFMWLATKYWGKASLHASSAFGLATLFGLAYGYEYYALLALALIVAWSRLELKAHTLSQVIVGGAIGVAAPLLAWAALLG